MKNLSINFYRYLTLSIVWGGVIVYLLIIYSPKFGLPTSFPFLDKVVHFILFFIQSIFITNTIYEYRNRNNRILLIVSIISLLLLGVIIEIQQIYLPYRTFEIMDLISNFVGVFSGSFFIIYFRNYN
jgi:VanZ family protein